MSTVLSPWIAAPRPPATAFRLFCFPHAGGGALLFRQWLTLVPPGLAVLPVQLPGREERYREPALTDFDALLDAAQAALDGHAQRPFGLFGHSMGAIIAFELARRMAPDHLFVSACRAPHLHDSWPARSTLPTEDLARELTRLGGTPLAVSADDRLLRLLEPTLRADFMMCERYQPAPGRPLQCPIGAFGGADDAETPEESLRAWRVHTGGPFTLRTFPGGHFYLRDHAAELLAMIGADVSAGPQPSHPAGR
jgi:medium-chain acyl-[acyl-carrier-protein] hydrolase